MRQKAPRGLKQMNTEMNASTVVKKKWSLALLCGGGCCMLLLLLLAMGCSSTRLELEPGWGRLLVAG